MVLIGNVKCFVTEPSITVPIKRNPGPNDSDIYDYDGNKPVNPVTLPNNRPTLTNTDVYEKPDEEKSSSHFPSHVLILTIVLCLVAVAVIIIIIIMYIRRVHQKKYLYTTGRSVLTFSNPNYNASNSDVGPNATQHDKRPFLWKRLKYDKSQVCNKHEQ
jgi:hypothetical protein